MQTVDAVAVGNVPDPWFILPLNLILAYESAVDDNIHFGGLEALDTNCFAFFKAHGTQQREKLRPKRCVDGIKERMFANDFREEVFRHLSTKQCGELREDLGLVDGALATVKVAKMPPYASS
mmetsp:Transcript_63043/g.126444  ORF Transcript_63043/g.126444 Transcript_63043/m.126444 type:complete len:122 (+) Transcript_63043:1313-1678(+)